LCLVGLPSLGPCFKLSNTLRNGLSPVWPIGSGEGLVNHPNGLSNRVMQPTLQRAIMEKVPYSVVVVEC